MATLTPGLLRPTMMHQAFPGKPHFTEKNIPDLAGKIYIVTGSNTGVGKELARILYGANATVYMACRTESKAQAAIKDIESAAPGSKGKLVFMHLDLSDLTTIKPAVEAFAANEDKLDVLFNNAGVMVPPKDKKTAQGFDMQLGTNCVGPFLLTQLLTPTLKKTAAERPPGSVRVVWVSSIASELYSLHHGLDAAKLDDEAYMDKEPLTLYGMSKTGNFYHATEYGRRHKDDGIVSLAINPGNLDSDLYRTINDHQGLFKMTMQFFVTFLLHPIVYGAYTELFAGLSPDATQEKPNQWIGPWGRFYPLRSDIAAGEKPVSEGGTGFAEKFWDWTMKKVEEYL